jgi:[ribosomal protein S5]-alanine N-acetyltransferase
MVEIKGPRITLRSYKKEDAARIAEIGNNKKIAENMTDRFPHPYTEKEAREWVETATSPEKIDKNFVIIFEDEIVGGVGLSLHEGLHEGVATGGYWLGEDYWGKGIATEAWKLVIDYAFKNFDIHRVEASAFSWNPASMKIQEKCGLIKEGYIRKNIKRFGKICDQTVYGLLREEWEVLDGKSTL